MSDTTFGSILDTPSNKVEKPKPCPVGTYLFLVKGQPRMDKSSKKGTEFVEFTLNFLQTGEDVDDDAVAAWLNGRPLNDMNIKHACYLTENSLWRLQKFIEDCGIEASDQTLRQQLGATAGCQVLGTIKHEPSDDGTQLFARVADTAPVGA